MLRGTLPAILMAVMSVMTATAFVTAAPTPADGPPRGGAERGLAPAASLLDYEALSRLGVGASTTIKRLALDDDRTADLLLERFEILAPGARVVEASARGERALAPELVLLRGTVTGDPASRVFLSVSPYGTHGFVQSHDALLIISTGVFGDDANEDFTLRVSDAANLPAIGNAAPVCGVSTHDERLFPFGLPAPVGEGGGGEAGGGGGAITGAPCRVGRLAIESDWEFTNNLFGGSTAASSTYALTLIAAVSEIYQEDVNTRLLVSYLRVWAGNDDPYSPEGGDLLQQFRAFWFANEGDIERESAHLLSGRNDLPYGGVAYLSVLCSGEWGYGVSGYLNGSFPYPLQDNHGGNWDLVVVAHELGHNFGTLHTHDGFEPPIDNCGNGDCANAADGTIMSYCHTCAGGMTNIALTFHPLVQGRILEYMDSNGCDMLGSGVDAIDDQFTTFAAVPATLDVLLNDLAASCDPVVIDTFDAVSLHGGTITFVPADAGVPRDRLRYTPPEGFSAGDLFTYTIFDGGSATVRVTVEPLRQPDVTGTTEPGAAARYYALSAPSSLPDFDTLEPYANDVVADVDFASTGGNFASSGRADEVGAVFNGFVTVPGDGLYTFYTNSDDGSALYVGEQRIVNNDGLHGMVERSGSAALAAGPHRVRVEFFENGGGAGLIVSLEGPGMAKQPVPAAQWSHGLSCAGDVDGDGTVAFGDLLLMLDAWGPCGTPCPEDLDQDGVVGIQDLLVLLNAWGNCD